MTSHSIRFWDCHNPSNFYTLHIKISIWLIYTSQLYVYALLGGKNKNYWTDFKSGFFYKFRFVIVGIPELGQRTNWHSEFVIELQAGISGSPQHCLKATSWLIYFSECCARLSAFLVKMVVLLIISLIISSASGILYIPYKLQVNYFVQGKMC